MIDVPIMQRLQSKFPDDFHRTSSHKFRASDDVQYAFAYFWFLMEDTAEFTGEEFCRR
jgi:UDP-N-acetylglucosamine-lysosomal-enzyme